MSPPSIDRVLAEMSETGTSRRSVTKEPKIEPSSSPGEIPNSPNIFAIPPMTRHSTEPHRSSKTSSVPQRSSAGQHHMHGPVPASGTPQDRFAAILGRSNSHSVPVPVPATGMGMAMGMANPNPPFLRHPTVNIPSTSSKGGSNTGAQPASRTTQSLTAPATRKPPTGTATDTLVVNNDSNGGNGYGGRGPALPDPWAPATMWLSYECQRRGFNPEFKPIESSNRSGEVWYRCTVFLNDIIIHDNTKFATAADAKAYVAEKALKQLRHKWPMPGPTKGFQHVPPTTASDKQVSDPVRRQEELRQQLMRRNKSKIAETTQYNLMASSNIDMGDPAQARAFVEGYKMAQLAAQRAADEPRSLSRHEPSPKLRTRSRSPTSQKAGSHSRGGRAHRHRSPFRDSSRAKGASSSRHNHGARRHRSGLPSTDRYRPSHIDAEDRRGRLREFDDGRKRQ
ncbi:hypothetical protein VPNG_03836 [Cytospora leucostoma]|uniref:Uncharacterized protein n=1 Tax=Cytospora leucostoma TaxID=1230097 RepID=A0A423XF06_9PEZI|nr:hypothetical protein VPNG_03836 [Cytospora leucostoma]